MDSFDGHSELYQGYARQLAQRLRVLRDERHIAQEYVAYHAGIPTFTYQKFEKGESNPGTPMNPRFSTIIALAMVFEIEPWELIRFE
ncbi:MAG: helix-turn-helix transcriptional regulator [Coriobacteriales bacterium]|nr:helix-turn-helix transcriptional regulator [Coriobacteriales bacterium]